MALINRVDESDSAEQAADQKTEIKEGNLQKLAEMILRLLKEEARQERERLGLR
jgi:hypothetical protein